MQKMFHSSLTSQAVTQDRLSHECGHGTKAGKCYPRKKPGHAVRSLRIDNTHIRLKRYRVYLQQEEKTVHKIQPLQCVSPPRPVDPFAAKHLTSYCSGTILTLLVIRSEIEESGGVSKDHWHTLKQKKKHSESERGKDIPLSPHSTGYGLFSTVKNILNSRPFSWGRSTDWHVGLSQQIWTSLKITIFFKPIGELSL